VGDCSYMIVTVDDCPTKRRHVANLLDYYDLQIEDWGNGGRRLDNPDEVAVGIPYSVEQCSCGSAVELGERLIAEAPKCSFVARQDPAWSGLGDVLAFSPKLGKFQAEVDNEGTVIKDHRQIMNMLDDAATFGIGGDLGQRAVLDVSFGVPWLEPCLEEAEARRHLWVKVIDAIEARTWRQRREQLGTLTVQAGNAGLDAAAAALQDIWDAPLPKQIAAVRAVKDTAEQAAREAATPEVPAYNTPQGSVAYGLRLWADVAETAWQGRRRP
jgi:hypothetical protein